MQVAYFIKEVNTSLAQSPLNFNRSLVKLVLIFLIRKARDINE